jgi:Uma2 family endonuclease
MTTTVEEVVAEKLYSVAEWLELEKVAEMRHEYHYGKLIPMAGEAKRANIIAGNVKRALDVPLYAKSFLIFDHDVKAEVLANGIYRYPDLVVAPVVDDEDDYIVKYPVMLVEVASESSGQRDRAKKRKEYLRIESLWYYLIVDQDEMLLELHARSENGQWLPPQYLTEPDEKVELPRFDLAFAVADVYQRLKIDV